MAWTIYRAPEVYYLDTGVARAAMALKPTAGGTRSLATCRRIPSARGHGTTEREALSVHGSRRR